MKKLISELREFIKNYEDDLEEYEENLYCSRCGNDSKESFTYYRTVANGDVYWCEKCKEENLVGNKPNEDNY